VSIVSPLLLFGGSELLALVGGSLVLALILAIAFWPKDNSF